MPPGENPLGPFRAEKLPASKKREDLPGKDFGQPLVVKVAHPMEDARLLHAALGHQEMQMGWKLIRSPNVWMTATIPGSRVVPATT